MQPMYGIMCVYIYIYTYTRGCQFIHIYVYVIYIFIWLLKMLSCSEFYPHFFCLRVPNWQENVEFIDKTCPVQAP